MSKLGISSLFKTILPTAALTISFTTSAFTEGTGYIVLEKPIPNADRALIRVSSYACLFCCKYDKAVTGPVSREMKDIVAFASFHPETEGEYSKQASEVFTVLINKDKAAGISLFNANSQFEKAKFAYYTTHYDRKKRWSDSGDPAVFIKAGLDTVGVSQADFEAAPKEPAVQEILKKWKTSYDVAEIQGAPAYVVNGKYLIYTKSTRSVNVMADLIRELTSR